MPQGADGIAVTNQAFGQKPLQRNTEGVKPDGNGGEEAYCHKSLDDPHGSSFNIPSAIGVFDPTLEGTDHKAYSKERPPKVTKEGNDGLDPRKFEQFYPHVLHHDEEVPKEAYHQAVEPVDNGVQDCGGNKVPNEQRFSPPIVHGISTLTDR